MSWGDRSWLFKLPSLKGRPALGIRSNPPSPLSPPQHPDWQELPAWCVASDRDPDCQDRLALLSLKLLSLDALLSVQLVAVDWWTEMSSSFLLGALLDCSFSDSFFFLALIALITPLSESELSWSQRKPSEYQVENERTHEAAALQKF